MSGHGSDHPPLPPDAAGPPQSFGTARYRSPSRGQNFRNSWGQNFRNPQHGLRTRMQPGRHAGSDIFVEAALAHEPREHRAINPRTPAEGAIVAGTFWI